MEKRQDPSQNFDMRKAMELAGSPAGRQLFELLQAQNSPQLQKAMSMAAAGDHLSAKQALSKLLEDPKVRDLLKQLEG